LPRPDALTHDSITIATTALGDRLGCPGGRVILVKPRQTGPRIA
jgi:hypothetical protein